MGSNINTDVIIPGEFLSISDPKELAMHAFSVMGQDFVDRLKKCDIIVADENFGCGSSREQATVVIKELGIKAVIAKSFARIFFRNAINSGLPAIECPELHNSVREGDEITIDFKQCGIKTPKGTLSFGSFPENIRGILEVGGLFEYLKASSGK